MIGYYVGYRWYSIFTYGEILRPKKVLLVSSSHGSLPKSSHQAKASKKITLMKHILQERTIKPNSMIYYCAFLP